MAYETYETKAPWILFRYLRKDWVAMLIGSRIRLLCLVCGTIRMLNLWPWQVWFPNRFPRRPANYMHPVRAEFLMEHYHSDKNMQPMRWAIPLANPHGWREWSNEVKERLGFRKVTTKHGLGAT